MYWTSELFCGAEKWFLNTEFLCCFVLGFWQVTSLSCDTTYSFYDNTNFACSELTTMLFPTVNPNNYVFSALARKYFWNLIEWWQFEKCSTSICILETYGSYRNRNIIRFKYLWNYVLLKLIQGGYEIISRLENGKKTLKPKLQFSFIQCSNWYRSTKNTQPGHFYLILIRWIEYDIPISSKYSCAHYKFKWPNEHYFS